MRVALALALAGWAGVAAAAEPSRPAMPEPLLGESITDLDGDQAGELEFDLTAGLPAWTQDGAAWTAGVEAEWRATRHLGVEAEVEAQGPFSPQTVGARLGVSWSLLHDLEHNFHLQAEVTARLVDDQVAGVDISGPVGDAALPFSAGLRAGTGFGPVTVRAALGAEAGAESAHEVPVWAGLAALVALGPEGRLGFAGLDSVADWGRRSPWVLAPTLGLSGGALHLPLQLQLAVPIRLGSAGEATELGLVGRFVVEMDLLDKD